MIDIKTSKDIVVMAEGGRKLADICAEILKKIQPGVTGKELDTLAEKLIKKNKGFPSFKTVKGYEFSTCLCLNDIVVHGIPTDSPLRQKDLVGIDVGMLYKGFHTDMAWTIWVGKEKNQEIDLFLKTGQEALSNAISQTRIGNHIGHISKAIQETVQKNGYTPVKVLVGHGIGKKLHEEPPIPCFLKGKPKDTPRIEEGMVLAIEIIYNMGDAKVVYKNEDGWTISTRDRSLSGLFEHTIAVTKKGPIILTHSDKFDKITN